MKRCMRLTVFYLGIFCTVFFSTYTVSVYKPTPIIVEIIDLTKQLIEKIPNEHRLLLCTPLEHSWNHYNECLRTYLNNFEKGVEIFSGNTTDDKLNSTINHLKRCIEKLKKHCKIIHNQHDNISHCENETGERNINVFMKYLLEFSKFLNRGTLCHNIMPYKDYYYVNQTYHIC